MIFDPIGGKGIAAFAEAAAYQGIIFEYGALAPEPTPFPLFTALSKGLTVRGYTLREILSEPQLKAEAVKYVFDRVRAGDFKPRIDRVFPFRANCGGAPLHGIEPADWQDCHKGLRTT